MERALASIQRIVGIYPIEGADKIERAKVLGWDCVIKKGEFKEGELIVYIEIDSILPFNPWTDFLRDKNRPTKPIRLRTVKMKGQISQGLVISCSQLPADCAIEEGKDVTAILGIIKYEPSLPPSLSGLAKGLFPSFIHKTDEPRIQGCPGVLNELKGVIFNATEKLDGTSSTFYLNNDLFGVCSRNMELKETEGNLYWQMAKKYSIEERLRKLKQDTGFDHAFQGETVGPGIGGNKLKLMDTRLYMFNCFNITKQEYYPQARFEDVCNSLELPMVPVRASNFPLDHTVEQLIEMVSVKSVITPEAWAEGFVFRPITEMVLRKLGRVSFKCINPQFLLQHGE